MRVTAPLDLGTFIVEGLLKKFLERYARVALEFDFSNRLVDLVSEGFDLALRASDRSRDSSLIARSLAPISFGLYASPAWLSRFSPIKTPRDMLPEELLCFAPAGKRKAQTWEIVSSDGSTFAIEPRSRLRMNDYLALSRATAAGLGLGLLPNLACRPWVARGELKRVLPDWSSAQGELFALYPSRRYLPPKTRAFVSFLQEELNEYL